MEYQHDLIVRKNGVRPAVNDFVTNWSKTNSYTNNVIVLFHENERWDTFYPPDTELVLLVVRQLITCPINPLQRYSAAIYSSSKMNLLCN